MQQQNTKQKIKKTNKNKIQNRQGMINAQTTYQIYSRKNTIHTAIQKRFFQLQSIIAM